jgi:hypothetical protein
MKHVPIVLFFLLPTITQAVEYNCKVEQKFDSAQVYSADQLQKGQYSVVIKDNGVAASLSRCSFSPSNQAITCDQYEVAKIVFDKQVKIKKYYVFNSQFDVQMFSGLTFIENNGRGGIAYGKCSLVSP